ncbi:hypothetical protein E4K64_06755 [Bradyrhizobium frederickii]|uniref:Uncharacterized protein n=1 Tax=Bradyrhizobium frederickii TaxID=2560054 RepID=A0A4Y9PGN7_9BRAD|nr:hypothetical protein [Bradyrhizobium frederickii]TFV78867.1 hypothetical protein E4K64_06755 [Bradyrhizobium frederickii]
MLPGFRFLFAAILLSTSILVFGLGAAALLRASHEQYVSNPSWRNGPQEQMFAQASEPAQPVLAVLRAEPEITAEPEPSVRDQVPTIGLPVTEPEQVAALTAADVPTQAAAPPAEAAAVEPAKSATTADATAPAPADTLTQADTTASIPDAKPDSQPAAVATASEPAPVDPSAALVSSAPEVASSKLAALNDPATTAVKDAPAKAKVDSKADDKATKRKAKAKKPHRVARRPPPQQLQQQLDPFGQQQPAFATTTARTR